MRLSGSHAKSCTRLHNNRVCDHGVTIAFFFDISSDKQIIVKSYLQLGKKFLNPMEETRGKTSVFINTKNFLAP